MASDGVRQRFCIRCTALQELQPAEGPRPCVFCGGTNFDAKLEFALTESDKSFLKVQRIKVDE